MQYPQRHNNHSLEERSLTFLRNQLPRDWNINSIDRDYGQDLNLEISEDGQYRGLELVLQLKSSKESNINNGFERQIFKVSTYNYLWNNLRVVMLVKYVEELDQAYYILLKDVEPPDQEQKTFTIYIPEDNQLHNINWNNIVEHVKMVSHKKLAANRG